MMESSTSLGSQRLLLQAPCPSLAKRVLCSHILTLFFTARLMKIANVYSMAGNLGIRKKEIPPTLMLPW